jgi:Kef-type K+ transport system membrane component KefB
MDTMHADPSLLIMLALAVLLASAKAGGFFAQKLGQPSVLGELLAGMILGNLGLIYTSWDVFHALKITPQVDDWAVVIQGIAQIGVILLLFEIGLECTVAEMRGVMRSSLSVAVAGVVAPFLLGYALSFVLITEVPAGLASLAPGLVVSHIHLFIGATLCATSVGITARVLRDLGKMHTRESQIILGAAVIDDVLGLLILAIVANVIVAAESGAQIAVGGIMLVAGKAVVFLAGALLLGRLVLPRIMDTLGRVRQNGLMLTASLVLCFSLSYLAGLAGLAPIIGAFAAGLILEEVHFREFREDRSLRDLVSPVATLFVPVFFVVMGIQVRLELFARMDILGLVVALTIVAFIGKQVCGLAAIGKRLDRLSIGLGMVPRGEVGLIFASIGKGLHVIDDALFSAIVMMVVLTTLITPILLRYSLLRARV